MPDLSDATFWAGAAALPLVAAIGGLLWVGGVLLGNWLRYAFKWHNLSKHSAEKRAEMGAYWAASWMAGHRTFSFKPGGALIVSLGAGVINQDLHRHLLHDIRRSLAAWNADVDPESGKRRATVRPTVRRPADTTEETGHS